MKAFPMPNDTRDGRIVLASAWYTEEPDASRAAIMLLNPEEPFYSVHIVNLESGDDEMRSRHENVIDAAIEYADLMSETLERS